MRLSIYVTSKNGLALKVRECKIFIRFSQFIDVSHLVSIIRNSHTQIPYLSSENELKLKSKFESKEFRRKSDSSKKFPLPLGRSWLVGLVSRVYLLFVCYVLNSSIRNLLTLLQRAHRIKYFETVLRFVWHNQWHPNGCLEALHFLFIYWIRTRRNR